MEKEKRLSTDSYKGVRDFYPQDLAVQNYIFSIWKKVSESFGYEEYGASVLESAELYRAKSGEEIVNEQTYTFKDRGDREVTLRPEMTPTVARMIASKRRELVFPLRWYSIPNLFRYEKPQKGRLREHWQLNVDIFGVSGIQAEVEIISIASSLLRSFGMKDSDFEIRINNRKILNYVLNELFSLSSENAHRVSKLIDKRHKISAEEFSKGISELVGEKSSEFLELINSQNFEEFVSHLPETAQKHEGLAEIKNLIENLENLGIANVVFDQSLMRGFDYYTGIVFEVFDKNPENRRSVFGGGRYDDLLSIFGEEKVPAVGFGTGDVIMKDLLTSYGLMPENNSPINLYICVFDEKFYKDAQELAQKIRESNIKTTIDYSGKKIGEQVKSADKHGAKFVICIGEDEIKSENYKVKNLKTGEEKIVSTDKISEIIKSRS